MLKKALSLALVAASAVAFTSTASASDWTFSVAAGAGVGGATIAAAGAGGNGAAFGLVAPTFAGDLTVIYNKLNFLGASGVGFQLNSDGVALALQYEGYKYDGKALYTTLSVGPRLYGYGGVSLGAFAKVQANYVFHKLSKDAGLFVGGYARAAGYLSSFGEGANRVSSFGGFADVGAQVGVKF